MDIVNTTRHRRLVNVNAISLPKLIDGIKLSASLLEHFLSGKSFGISTRVLAKGQ